MIRRLGWARRWRSLTIQNIAHSSFLHSPLLPSVLPSFSPPLLPSAHSTFLQSIHAARRLQNCSGRLLWLYYLLLNIFFVGRPVEHKSSRPTLPEADLRFRKPTYTSGDRMLASTPKNFFMVRLFQWRIHQEAGDKWPIQEPVSDPEIGRGQVASLSTRINMETTEFGRALSLSVSFVCW